MDTARRYAQRLLDSLVGRPSGRRVAIDVPDQHPAITWRDSGMMALTGWPGGDALMCPVPIASCADGVIAALSVVAPHAQLPRGSSLLSQRAQISGFTRNGAVSPGGGCYLLDTRDGAIAANLVRDEDWSLVPAWLEAEAEPAWDLVKRIARERTMHDLVERGRMLGLAVAPDVPVPSQGVAWQKPWPEGRSTGSRESRPPLVVDLSSLWAGPLCSHLLQRCGARVIKVESAQRPDGARRGPREFFDALNAGKEFVTVDFASPAGRAQLRDLILRADIVIEGSRPRALRQLGIDAQALVRERKPLTWIGITGHGRGEPAENWVAFGDDAGVAAGLSHVMRQATGQRLIVGDAIADPFTGMHAALAAWASYRNGGGGLIALSLVDVVRHCIQFDLPGSPQALQDRAREWQAIARG
jgi:hypothetical protein